MLCSLSLSLALALAGAPAPGDLSPEAAEHNAKAMRFYDAGQLAPAVDEFYAAYQSMPDARGSLAGREQLLGSMRATLLALLAENGDVAPLCRLQSLLQGHADALTAAYPDDPNKLETRSARARHREVTQQLTAFEPDACDPAPPPPLLTATTTMAEPPTPSPAAATPPNGDVAPRRLQIAGGVLVPLGVVALGVVGAVASRYRGNLAEADTLQEELTNRRCTDEDRTRMGELLSATRREEGLMIALGLTGGALVTVGTALLVRGGLQRRRARLALDLRQNRFGLTIAGQF